MKPRRKTELNYRQGDYGQICIYCENYRRPAGITLRAGGVPGPSMPRCTVIGLKIGRQYDIEPGAVCDAFKPKGRKR